ncbi:hypothetical protein NQ317_010127 [Molorchus minor]|uniref:ZAD domain-containing protein n=1 Tax=Molorchus minor TaxID=1323400 RepID=A0ABQ9JMB0_9CUCU|nr:hypothetical protein NQ317_010127 [Molorchus minor]
MESTQDIKVPVCRLCLEVDCYSNFQQLENGNDLKLVLPDLNYTLTTDPVICSKCREMLQKSSCFKTTCKQTEDYLTNVRINNTSVFNELFNRKLENDTIKGDGGRCRLCMRQSECCSPLCVVKYMLEKCFSEMDMTLVQNPVICNSCIEDLQGHYNLMVSCLDIEDKIRNYHVEKGVTLNNTNLHEMRLSLIKMESYNKNYNRGSDDFISKRIKLEDEFRDMESTIKTEEISIKDEADGEQKMRLGRRISEINVYLSAPANACDDKTDEDSGEEDLLYVHKLPTSHAPYEIEQCSSRGIIVDHIPKQEPHIANYIWVKNDIKKNPVCWQTESVSHLLLPMELFQLFFDDALITMITDFSNKFAIQRNRIGDITKEEIKSFLGILILSGYNSMSGRYMYWEKSADVHNSLVAKAISKNRFEYILSNIHVCDNEKLDNEDRYAKVRPLITSLNKKFQENAIHAENHRVYQTMATYLERKHNKDFAYIRPIIYGYKFWIGGTSNGYVIWMEPCQSSVIKETENIEKFGLNPSVVLEYTDVLLSLKKCPYHIVLGKSFTTLPLLEELSRRGLRGTGAISDKELSNCPLEDGEEMRNGDRGHFDYYATENNSVIVVRWYGNTLLTVASNSESVFPVVKTVKKPKYGTEECFDQPRIMKFYTDIKIDPPEENIRRYRTTIRGNKWYIPIITYCIDVSVQNAWQIHQQRGGTMDLLTFRRKVALSLLQNAGGRSTINTLLSKYAKLLPHKLDHNYSKVNTYSVQKYKSILNRYKFRGRGFHPFSKNRQNVRVILRNIRILNKKIRKNEKIIKDEMKRLQNLEAVLNGLKSDNLDDSTFDILAECENRE